MTEFIKKYEIWVFLVIGPIINALFVYARIQGIIPRFLYIHGRFCVLLLVLLAIVKFTKGNEGIKDIFRPMLKWKVNPKWYLFSLLFAMSVGSITLIFKGLLYESDIFSFLHFDFAGQTLKGCLVLLIWAFLGEVVWVSYCVRELSKIVKPFYASLLVGLFWTLWWIPIIYHGEGILPGIPIGPLSIFMMGIAGMCAVVYGRTKSGVVVLVMQFMVNMTLNILSVSPTKGGVPTFTAFAITYFLTMLIFMYFMNPNKRDTQPSSSINQYLNKMKIINR
tara:strand:+ start:39311 stop:40144 length:834 start_codon:yes stop_codon:yes gene_type:complete